MRKWHRWLSIFTGIFILFIAITGVASQFAAIYANGTLIKAEAPKGPPPSAGAASDGQRRPPQTPARKLVGLLHHLHSGESFGPAGVIASILSGLALIFFAISGMWMYVQMFLRRKGASRCEWFWK